MSVLEARDLRRVHRTRGSGYVERAPWTVLAPTLALALAAVLAVSLSSLEREA
ncbi:hypothetical protein [Luteococcus peritonei]|uniref:ABC transporter permease n=1 Tax=Luteococcus peritonei TaxID=88874 RepID=A0ABW4RSU6_9ACTN